MLSEIRYRIKMPFSHSLGISRLSSHTFFRRSTVTTATSFQNKSLDSRPEFFTTAREGTASACLYSHGIIRVVTAYSFCKPTLSSLRNSLSLTTIRLHTRSKHGRTGQDPGSPCCVLYCTGERQSFLGYMERASQHSSAHLPAW